MGWSLTHFTRARLAGTSEDALLARYADWALGLGAWSRMRGRRLELGVGEAWTPEELVRGAELVGDGECEIFVERRPGGAVFRFLHEDDVDERVVWHTVVRLAREGGRVRVEHGVARELEAGARAPKLAAPPAVLVALLDDASLDVAPRALARAEPLVLAPERAAAFVREELLDPAREAPVAVVSMPEATSVDATRLARALRGTASVFVLDDPLATAALEAALVDAGLARRLACPVAGARLYRAGLRASDAPERHARFEAEALAAPPPARRAPALAAEIAASVVPEAVDEAFFEEV